MTRVDVLFLAWNRLAFSQAAFDTMVANTDWDTVDTLYVHDDASEDGTKEWLHDACHQSPAQRVVFHSMRLRGPVAAMKWYLGQRNRAPAVAKIDNDILLPSGWLGEMLTVLDRDPELLLLGMEAGMTVVAGRDGEAWDGVRRAEPCTHIGGIGLIRTEIFDRHPRLFANGRNGWTEYQHTHDPKRAWITPDLACPLLDRLPFDPWATLSDQYVGRHWQRDWPRYDPVWMRWAWEPFFPDQPAEAAA